ncbi:hypothetical protein [Mycobacterium tuberculosis]|uniref:hypothetical protein n=1 Tax=Mycobacterium tuberculosis TaxID=1773 RepID=UPI0023DEB9B5|nr:hypothetical protein [Mycobacterium tuberculosis]
MTGQGVGGDAGAAGEALVGMAGVVPVGADAEVVGDGEAGEEVTFGSVVSLVAGADTHLTLPPYYRVDVWV